MKECLTCKKPVTKKRGLRCNRCYNLDKNYGLNSVEADWMSFLQGRVCAIDGCSNEATEIDHNHDTGKVRAVLCRDCNTNLAVLESPLFTHYVKYLNEKQITNGTGS